MSKQDYYKKKNQVTKNKKNYNSTNRQKQNKNNTNKPQQKQDDIINNQKNKLENAKINNDICLNKDNQYPQDKAFISVEKKGIQDENIIETTEEKNVLNIDKEYSSNDINTLEGAVIKDIDAPIIEDKNTKNENTQEKIPSYLLFEENFQKNNQSYNENLKNSFEQKKLVNDNAKEIKEEYKKAKKEEKEKLKKQNKEKTNNKIKVVLITISCILIVFILFLMLFFKKDNKTEEVIIFDNTAYSNQTASNNENKNDIEISNVVNNEERYKSVDFKVGMIIPNSLKAYTSINNIPAKESNPFLYEFDITQEINGENIVIYKFYIYDIETYNKLSDLEKEKHYMLRRLDEYGYCIAYESFPVNFQEDTEAWDEYMQIYNNIEDIVNNIKIEK